MKIINILTIAGNRTKLSLHKLVDDIIISSSPVPVDSKSTVVNHVPANLFVNTNENIVASVIDGLLQAMITNSTESDIQISGKELSGNTIKVYVKDNNCYNTYAVACSLQKLVPLAEQIGGYLNIMNQKQKITTIEFSFPVAKEDDESEYDD